MDVESGSAGGQSGPLAGVRVVELAGLGAAPFACMVLADLGADVLRVDRADAVGRRRSGKPSPDVLTRGRRSVGIDLKHPEGVATVLRLVESADVFVEGFRPGVTERLGVGPDECLARNPRLVYGRMTGWGQTGPYASSAGHDLNYIALSGALHPIGPADRPPVPPLSLVGDFGGGGLLLAMGIVSALYERERSGAGQVIDAAMVEGAALLSTFFHGGRKAGFWTDERGANLLDGGAPFYNTYETADGRFISVGAIEPQFYAELLERLGLPGAELPEQLDRAQWPAMRERLAELFRSRTRAEWCQLLEATDSCFAPVLGLGEVADHPHHRARQSFIEISGIVQPAPAPRFSRTPAKTPSPPPRPGRDTEAGLCAWGFGPAEIHELREVGAIQ